MISAPTIGSLKKTANLAEADRRDFAVASHENNWDI